MSTPETNTSVDATSATTVAVLTPPPPPSLAQLTDTGAPLNLAPIHAEQPNAIAYTPTQWAEILKTDTDALPVIKHPTLGDVVEVRPGLLARQVSIADKFKEHLATFDGPRMPTEELEQQRFHAMLYAQSNGATQLRQELLKVSSEEQMQVLLKEDKKNVGGIEKSMEHFGPKSTLFQHDEAEAKKVYDKLKADGRVRKLTPGMVKDGRLSQEAVNELRRDYNVVIKRRPDQDVYMNEIRQNAANAMAFVEGKISVGAGEKGIDDSSTPEEKAEFQLALAAATNAISLFEQEKNVITRKVVVKEDENITVRVDLDDYYKKLAAAHVQTNDVRQFMHEFGPAIHLSFASSAPKSNELMIFLETLDCALFVPRLCCLLADQPLPRVIEFSRIYNVYRATAGVLQMVNPLPSEKQLEREKKKLKRELDKMVEDDGGVVEGPSEAAEEAARVAGSWTNHRTSRQAAKEGCSKLRVEARTALLEKIVRLQDWYKTEVYYHKTRGSNAENMKKKGMQPQFTLEEVKADPNLIALCFYKQMWVYAQEFATDVLLSYEFLILLQLEAYMPKHTKDFWRSVKILPSGRQCPDVTKNFVETNNEALLQWRTFDSSAVINKALNKYMVAIPFIEEIEYVRVDSTQPWSPTVKQIRKYYKDMCSLFMLNANDVNKIIASHHANRNAKNKREMEESLKDYVASRAGKISLPVVDTVVAEAAATTTATATTSSSSATVQEPTTTSSSSTSSTAQSTTNESDIKKA